MRLEWRQTHLKLIIRVAANQESTNNCGSRHSIAFSVSQQKANHPGPQKERYSTNQRRGFFKPNDTVPNFVDKEKATFCLALYNERHKEMKDRGGGGGRL